MTPKEIDREIVLSWLQGDYSVTQLRMLQDYLQDPAYRESLENFLQEEWGALDVAPQPSLPDLEQQYDKFLSQLQTPEPELSPLRTRPASIVVPPPAAAPISFLLAGVIWCCYYCSG